MRLSFLGNQVVCLAILDEFSEKLVNDHDKYQEFLKKYTL